MERSESNMTNLNMITTEELLREVISRMGEDVEREGLVETPKRWAKALKEMTQGYNQDASEILNKSFESTNRNMVICRDIEFYSMCEHHVLPFKGKVHIGYIPNGRVVGLSKLARVVEVFARRLQIQEQLTEQIAEAIETAINATGVAVVVEAEHLCMKARGVRNHSSVMTTSALRGALKETQARMEFLSLIGK
jgi:GTP cyclohydrolase I